MTIRPGGICRRPANVRSWRSSGRPPSLRWVMVSRRSFGLTIGFVAPAFAFLRHLYVFAAVPPIRRKIVVAEALQGRAWVGYITGPLTVQLLTEFVHLWGMPEEVQFLHNTPDTFSWRLSPSAYGAMFFGSSTPLGAKQIWKTSAPPRVRFFFWLVMHKRCWTAETKRHRHGLQDSETCVICDQAPETMNHLLLGCVFSREVWGIWLRKLHLHDLVVVQEEQALHAMVASK